MTAKLDLDRFEELAMRCGPDPAGWPDGTRAEAEALLARSAEARAVRDRVAALFDALEEEAAAAPPVPDALMARILADAAAEAPAPAAAPRAPARPAARRRLGLGPLLARLAPHAAIAASAAVGLALGYVAPESYVDPTATAEEEVWTEAFYLTTEPGLFGEIDEVEGL